MLKFAENPVSTKNCYWNNPSKIYPKIGKPDTCLGSGGGDVFRVMSEAIFQKKCSSFPCKEITGSYHRLIIFLLNSFLFFYFLFNYEGDIS